MPELQMKLNLAFMLGHQAGACDVFVAGSAVFHTSNYGERLRLFRARIAEALKG